MQLSIAECDVATHIGKQLRQRVKVGFYETAGNVWRARCKLRGW